MHRLVLCTGALFTLTATAFGEFLSIAEINRRIVSREICEGDTLTFSGQLIARTDSHLFLRDETSCIRVQIPADVRALPDRGDVIEVTARREPVGVPLHATSLHVTEHRPAPEPVDIPGGLVSSGEYLNSYVRTKGVVFSSVPDELDSRYSWTLLKTETGPVAFATLKSRYPPEELKKLIDAEVSIQGVVLRFSTWRTALGGRIEPIGETPLTVTRPAPTDLDEIPPFTGSAVLHRQRTSGTVVAVSRNRFFVRKDDAQHIQVKPTDASPLPRPGNRVTVAGFAELDPLLNLRLVEALVRIDSTATLPPEPISEISFDSLFEPHNGNVAINATYNQKAIRLRGHVRDLPEPADPQGVFTLVGNGRTVSVDASALHEGALDALVPGCLVDVSGFCIGEFDPPASAISFPTFRGFTVIPRETDDITVLSRPPWWTTGRLLVLVALLAALVVAVLVWNAALRRISERRGRELAREQLRHAESDLKVEERTRLAVELHDALSQTLTGVALQIDAAKGAGLASGTPAACFLETARAMLASCRQELRCCIWDLRSRTFEEKDMTEAVLRTLAPHAGDVDIQVRFNVPRKILSESTTHDILCIVRELVVNAIRHGKARHIKVAGERHDGQISFSVRDDGRGFDPAAVPGARQGHFGLQGIRERARAYSGTVDIESASGNGSKVTVSFASDDKEENEP